MNLKFKENHTKWEDSCVRWGGLFGERDKLNFNAKKQRRKGAKKKTNNNNDGQDWQYKCKTIQRIKR